MGEGMRSTDTDAWAYWTRTIWLAMVSPDRKIVLPVALEGIPPRIPSDRFNAL